MAKFKDLTPENIEYLKHIYYEEMTHQEKMDILSSKFSVSPRTIRNWWKKQLNLSERYSSLPPQIKNVENREIPKGTDVVLFTACQNKTGVNNNFLDNLQAYKSFLESKGKTVEIIIAPTRYRNPTSPTEERGKKTEQWWVDEVIEYLYYGNVQFGDTILSTSSRVIPTAKEPLMGFEVLAKDNSLVIPHSKIHFKTLSRFKNMPLRTMSTTGYISNKNYSDSKAGTVAYQHHAYGFVIVEKKKDNTCHIPRNVKVKSDGSFIDIIYEVNKKQVSTIESSEGFVWGDIHACEIDIEVLQNTYVLYADLKPKKTILHDVFDGSTLNPHEVKDMYIQKKKIRDGRYLIDQEIEQSFDVIESIKEMGTEVYVSISNHDVFLDRHINDSNWKKDLHNSENYLKYAYIQQTEDIEKFGSVYGYLLNEKFNGEVIYLNYGDSLDIEGYECALHGDHGTNGSRGSYKQFSKLNTKMISAHSHSPVLHNSVTVVGVSAKLNQYYTRKGMSSWAHAHSVIHSNGKNQLLVFDDDYKVTSLI